MNLNHFSNFQLSHSYKPGIKDSKFLLDSKSIAYNSPFPKAEVMVSLFLVENNAELVSPLP